VAEEEFDPFVRLEDPYPLYARLRQRAPLHYAQEHDVWSLPRFVEVQAAARDWATFTHEHWSRSRRHRQDYVRRGRFPFEGPSPPRPLAQHRSTMVRATGDHATGADD
jgi:hypothetical protein